MAGKKRKFLTCVKRFKLIRRLESCAKKNEIPKKKIFSFIKKKKQKILKKKILASESEKLKEKNLREK